MNAKIFSLILLLLSVFVSAEAKWSKYAGITFSKAKEYKVVIDMDSIDYDGMEKDDFLEYTASHNDMQPEQLSVSLKYMSREIIKNLNENSKKTFSVTSDSPYIITIRILKITSKAGISSLLEFSMGNYNCYYEVDVNDGRWNRFDVLLQENCEELAKKINKCIKDSRYYTDK